MSNPHLSAPLSTESHLSAEQMHQYLDGALSSASRYEIEIHLIDCPICTEAMEGLALSTSPRTDRVLHDLNRQVKSRIQRKPKNRTLDFIKDWGIATAILFLLIVSAMVVWYQVKQNQPVKEVPFQKAAPLQGWKNFDSYMQLGIGQANAIQEPVEIPVSFTIEPDSTISNVMILKKISPALEEQALNLLLNGPKWVPARKNGQLIKSVQQYTLRIKPDKK